MEKSNNDVVIIELDRERELRFGHKALKTFAAMTGKKITEVNITELEADEIEKVVYCGLLWEAKEKNETLKLEQVEDLLDAAPSFFHVVQKIGEAFRAAFGGGEVPEGNQNPPVQTAE